MTLIRAIMEYNADGCLLYAENFTGAYARGKDLAEAAAKFPDEIRRYRRWLGEADADGEPCEVQVVEKKESRLQVCDADSDVLFHSERAPLSREEYTALRDLALRSAEDFQRLYDSIADKTHTVLSPRKTFYGDVPLTAEAMYAHTQNVNGYYFGEIGVEADNGPDIAACRRAGFAALEAAEGFLRNPVWDGSWGEQWTLRKLCRRFVWHDRIHARAMYRMASRLCGAAKPADPFCFSL